MTGKQKPKGENMRRKGQKGGLSSFSCGGIWEYERPLTHRQDEFHLQCQIVRWLKAQYPKVLFTASAGGMRTSIGTAKKMKAMGYSRGTPDLMIFRPKYAYPGDNGAYALFVEFKTTKGRVTLEQKDWIERLNRWDYKAIICRSFNEATKEIEEYLG